MTYLILNQRRVARENSLRSLTVQSGVPRLHEKPSAVACHSTLEDLGVFGMDVNRVFLVFFPCYITLLLLFVISVYAVNVK